MPVVASTELVPRRPVPALVTVSNVIRPKRARSRNVSSSPDDDCAKSVEAQRALIPLC
jgi:hypothetical protein